MTSLTQMNAIGFNNKRQGILTTLDTLFDVRLACLEEVNKDLAVAAICNNWAERVYDTVHGMDKETYDKLYEARDFQTLTYAHPTMIPEFIRGWCANAMSHLTQSPFGGFCEVFVNVWPYKIPRSIAVRLGQVLADTLAGEARVTMLNIDPKNITSLDAKRYFSCIIDVNHCTWLNERLRTTDFRICPIPDVTLYAPKVFHAKLNPADYSQFKHTDVFEQMAKTLEPVIRLEFLELEYFSTPVTADMLFDSKPIIDAASTPPEQKVG